MSSGNRRSLAMDKTKVCMSRARGMYSCEFVKDGLYFMSLWSKQEPVSNENTYFFSIDNELIYMNYYSDFGPLNLAMLYRYCMKVNILRKHLIPEGIRLVHYTSKNAKKRTNAAFLIGCYAIMYLDMTPQQVYDILLSDNANKFLEFRDASMVSSCYTITLLDCFEGLTRALQYGFFSFSDFNVDEYETFEMIQFGDLNWILPEKFIAFCGPCATGRVYKKPEFYINYFKMNNVTAVIRLNEATYKAASFQKAGIDHYELYFVDGGVPPHDILKTFLEISEKTKGAIAVHCKAGLGRTGSVIGAYLMKHYRMKAREAIAWLRICRPGSVICHQQGWLENMQQWLWKCGDYYRLKTFGNADCIMHHKYGIYSIKAKMIPKEKDNKDKTTRKLFCANYLQPLITQHLSPSKESSCKEKLNNRKKDKHTNLSHALPTENRKWPPVFLFPGKNTNYQKNYNYTQKPFTWQNNVANTTGTQQTNGRKQRSLSPSDKKPYTQGDYLRAIKLQQSANPHSSAMVYDNHSERVGAPKTVREIHPETC